MLARLRPHLANSQAAAEDLCWRPTLPSSLPIFAPILARPSWSHLATLFSSIIFFNPVRLTTAADMATMDRGRKPKVATSIPHWAAMMRGQFDIGSAGSHKNAKIWSADPASATFSSGSDLSEKDYLLLRVIWNSREDVGNFKHYMRDNSDLKDDKTDTPTPYTGYVTPENNQHARQIYSKLEPLFRGYLDDIRFNKDGTRPSPACQQFFMARYWQSLVMARIKSQHIDEETAALQSKVRKRAIPAPSAAAAPSADDDSSSSADELATSMANTSISEPPTTPVRQSHQAQPQLDTPAMPRSFPSVGGTRNPATSDETYVNTALRTSNPSYLSPPLSCPGR